MISDADLLNARIALRSTSFDLVKPVYDIARTKQYFLVKPKTRKGNKLMTIIDRSPECRILMTDNDKKAFNKFLRRIQHPFIHPVLYVDYNLTQGRAVIIRDIAEKGSLKDFIHQV